MKQPPQFSARHNETTHEMPPLLPTALPTTEQYMNYTGPSCILNALYVHCCMPRPRFGELHPSNALV